MIAVCHSEKDKILTENNVAELAWAGKVAAKLRLS